MGEAKNGHFSPSNSGHIRLPLTLGLINGAWVARAMDATETKKIILDVDSSESPVHGNQEGSAYNGHFLSRCYHPLLVFNQAGDC